MLMKFNHKIKPKLQEEKISERKMRVTLSKVFTFSSNISLYNKLTKIQSLVFSKAIFISSIDTEVINKGLDLSTCQNYMGGANFQLFYVVTHQM